MAPVGQSWFSAPSVISNGSGPKNPKQILQYPHIENACTHLTADFSSTQYFEQLVHATHLCGSICQTVLVFLVLFSRKAATPPRPAKHTPLKASLKK
jgi:hypothetical protein